MEMDTYQVVQNACIKGGWGTKPTPGGTGTGTKAEKQKEIKDHSKGSKITRRIKDHLGSASAGS